MRPISNSSGYSLVELMVTMGVATIMSLGMTTMMVNMQKSSNTNQAMSSHSQLVAEIQRSLSNSSMCKSALNLATVGETGSVLANRFAGQPGHNAAISLYHPSGAPFLSTNATYDKLKIKTLNLQVASTQTGSNLYAATLTLVTEVQQQTVTSGQYPNVPAPIGLAALPWTQTGYTDELSVVNNDVSLVNNVNENVNLLVNPSPSTSASPSPTKSTQSTAFGMQERTSTFQLSLVRNPTLGTNPVGRFDNCYNNTSTEEMSQTFCTQSLNGTWNTNTQKCQLGDVHLSGVPQPSVKGSMCQLRPDQCPTGTYQDYLLLNVASTAAATVGGGLAYNIPFTTSSSVVDPIIDQVEMRVHYCNGSWRGYFGLMVDGQNVTNTGEWTGIGSWDGNISVSPNPPNYGCTFSYFTYTAHSGCTAVNYTFNGCQIRGKTLRLTAGKESNEVYPFYIRVRMRTFATAFPQ